MFILFAVVISLLLCLYYVSQTQSPSGTPAQSSILSGDNGVASFERAFTSVVPDYNEPPDGQVSSDTCPLILPRDTEIDAQAEFEKFEFQVRFCKKKLFKPAKLRVFEIEKEKERAVFNANIM